MSGHVITGAISSPAVSDLPTQLLSVPGGVVVSVANTIGSGLALEIGNPTAEGLAAVVDNGAGTSAEHDLNPGATTSLPFSGAASRLHIQIRPDAGLAEVVTIVISVEAGATALPSIVGQAITGPS